MFRPSRASRRCGSDAEVDPVARRGQAAGGRRRDLSAASGDADEQIEPDLRGLLARIRLAVDPPRWPGTGRGVSARRASRRSSTRRWTSRATKIAAQKRRHQSPARNEHQLGPGPGIGAVGDDRHAEAEGDEGVQAASRRMPPSRSREAQPENGPSDFLDLGPAQDAEGMKIRTIARIEKAATSLYSMEK